MSGLGAPPPRPSKQVQPRLADLDRAATQALATKACSAVAIAMGSVNAQGRLVLRHIASYGNALPTSPPIRLAPICQFDTNSLTSALVPTLLAAQWASKNRLELDRTLGMLLPDMQKSPLGAIPLSALLDHTSGIGLQSDALAALLASLPKPERLIKSGTAAREAPRKAPTEVMLRRIEQQGGPLTDAELARVRQGIAELTPEAPAQTVEQESWLNPLLLGWVMEAASGLSLDALFRRDVLQPLNVAPAHVAFRRCNADGPYLPVSSRAGEAMAVASPLCPYRRRVPHGEPRDVWSYLQGGVSAHSGLFSTIDGLWQICAPLLDSARGIQTAFHAATIARFFTRSRRTPDARFALGWQIACRANGMAPGRWHPRSVGMVCPSGQSIFLDPGYGVLGILLTNWGTGSSQPGAMDFDTFRLRVFDTMASLASAP